MINEQKIWGWFKNNTTYSNEQIAGIMGNIQAESAGYPNNLQNTYEKSLGYTDDAYTNAVNDGTYRYRSYVNSRLSFGYDQAGYGLCQWTSSDRKLKMYDFLVANGRSIGDLEGQLEYLCYELESGYSYVNNLLLKTTTVAEASKVILQKYEIPAGFNSAAVINLRAKYSQAIYDTHSNSITVSQISDTSNDAITKIQNLKTYINNQLDSIIASL